MYECLLKRKMKGPGRKVANIVSKADDKKVFAFIFAVLELAAHIHISMQNWKRCAVQNSRKTFNIWLFPPSPSPKENFLTIPFVMEGTSICKFLLGSSDTKNSINHKVIVWHRPSDSDLCGSLAGLWRVSDSSKGRGHIASLSPKIAKSSRQMLESWIFHI